MSCAVSVLVQQWQTEMISCFVSNKKWNASVYIFVTPTGKIKVQQSISLNKQKKTQNNLSRNNVNNVSAPSSAGEPMLVHHEFLNQMHA